MAVFTQVFLIGVALGLGLVLGYWIGEGLKALTPKVGAWVGRRWRAWRER